MIVMALSISASAKNLSLLSKTRLNNYELLDVFLDGNIAYIPAGLGGLNIVDIADPAHPVVLSSYRAEGCDWGRIYAWTANKNYAFGVGRDCGVHIVDVSDLTKPEHVITYSDGDESELRYEHAELANSTLYLARHQHGVEIVDVSQAQSPGKVGVIPSQNAWATLATDNLLFIADGAAGVKIVDISTLSPKIIASITTSGTAKDLALSNSSLFVAVGAAGVDMINVSNPSNPLLVDNYNTSGYASRVSVSNGRVAVSDWDDVEVLEFSDGELKLVGYKNTGGRVMALSTAGDLIYSAEWTGLSIFKFGEIYSTDIDLGNRRLEFPRTPVNAAETLLVSIRSNGAISLEISDIQVVNPDFSVMFPSTSVPADSSMEVQVIYTPESTTWEGTLTFNTNDPDEQKIIIRMQGNHPYGPMVGDQTPPFELQSVNGFGTISDETYLGQPVVIAFFTSW